MNSVYVLAYLVVCYLLIKVLLTGDILERLTKKEKIIAVLGCLIYPSLFFLPYVFNFAPSFDLPDYCYWGPFLIISLAGIVVLTFYPERQKKYTPYFFVAILSTLVFLNLIPLILGIYERVLLLWIR